METTLKVVKALSEYGAEPADLMSWLMFSICTYHVTREERGDGRRKPDTLSVCIVFFLRIQYTVRDVQRYCRHAIAHSKSL